MPAWLIALVTAVASSLLTLVPPRSTSNDESMYRWMVAISAGVGGVIVVQLACILLVSGALAWAGIPGFVRADAFEAARMANNEIVEKVGARLFAIEQNQKFASIRNLDTSIQADYARLCRAQTDDSKQYFTDRVHEELRAWSNLTSAPYPTPTCDQLLTKSQ